MQGWIAGLKILILCLLVVAGLSVGRPNHANLSDAKSLDSDVAKAMMVSLVYIY